MDDKRYWIGYPLVKGIGAVRFQRILERSGDAESARQATPAELAGEGLGQEMIERLVAIREKAVLSLIWYLIYTKDIQVFTWMAEAYPHRLKEIEQPTPGLYLPGEMVPDDTWAVAIVGTRSVILFVRQITEEISTYLAANGVTIVSGPARGVDAIAHSAALKIGGRTLAVLDSGVDRIYPLEDRPLVEKIMHHGAIISDYIPTTPPELTNFPPRNRILLGLSMAVLVIEAGETSSALNNAEFAAEQGREVFAVPGNILAPQSKGTHKLIQQWALPMLSPSDIMQALTLTRVDRHKAAHEALPADEMGAKLLETMGQEPLHIDKNRNQTGLPVKKVSVTLGMMELKGMVRQVGNMQYVAVREVQSDYRVNDE